MTDQKDFKSYLVTLEDTLNLYLVKKAPSIPTNIKDLIVKFGPYLVALSLLSSLPSVLALFGLGSLYRGLGIFRTYRLSTGYQLSLLIMTVSFVLVAIALPGLFKKKLSSWRLLFYSGIVSFVYSLIYGNIISTLLSTLLGFYLLFQIKSYYK